MKLKELADQLGLSQTTVSRALNGYPEVNKATRERVSEAALKFGYSANANARRLAIGRIGAIGILMPRDRSERFGPHTSEFFSGLAEQLSLHEMDLLMSPSINNDELAAYRRLISSKRVDGIIVTGPTLMDERVAMLTEAKFPFVLHGRTNITAPHAWLDIDNAGAFRQATSHLLDLGHRHVAMIDGLKGHTFSEHREMGYREALVERGLPIDPRFIVHERFSDETGFHEAQRLLSYTPHPTAILAGSMMTALGVFRAIRSRGYELGKEVSVIAHDDVFPYLNASNMVPAMTTTRSSIRSAGSRIAELLVRVLDGEPVENIHEIWPVELVLRQSSGPPVAARR
ncbi:substrate-binding domain-containing protein [Phyllobacterium meliloti]|uniref:substrate-binding domain-containing protein n=1 Tax=Phyllobacterium meliloti TaxID=555317 RepID=UPI000DDC3446|nr:substrate-binding domain-containing protein [Phyllobacterium sp. T1293]UGX87502.1 substrate-binding domain-containing protein [Phyllobacterium sp. T1293]